MSFRFYVKSILESLEVRKLPFLAIFGALNFVDQGYFSLQKVQKWQIFALLKSPKLISRKI